MWKTETLNEEVDEILENLPIKIKVKMFYIIELLEKYGNEVKEPHTKSLVAGLFEIRAKGEEGIARAFFTFQKERIIILHCFIKKEQKIPKSEIQKARERLKTL